VVTTPPTGIDESAIERGITGVAFEKVEAKSTKKGDMGYHDTIGQRLGKAASWWGE
jgi:hypothetical protein